MRTNARTSSLKFLISLAKKIVLCVRSSVHVV